MVGKASVNFHHTSKPVQEIETVAARLSNGPITLMARIGIDHDTDVTWYFNDVDSYVAFCESLRELCDKIHSIIRIHNASEQTGEPVETILI